MTDRAEPTLRLFFAFELTDPVREFATRAQSILIDRLGRRDIRWTQPVDMHITALFIGNYSNARLSTFLTAGKTAAANAAPFDFTISGLGRFPERGAPRVIWLGGRDGEAKPASALINHLRAELSEFRLDAKPFKPHITLGYVRPEANRLAIDNALRAVPPASERVLSVERLVLMQTLSEIERRNSGGARYTTVHAFPFGADSSRSEE